MSAAESPDVVGLQSLQLRDGHPDLLDLPWSRPLAQWRDASPRVVQLQRGLSRHEVVFASWGADVYAFKELAPQSAVREYETLLRIEALGVPSVSAAGHARVRFEGGETASILVTRFLDGSLPFRTLFQSASLERYRSRLLDAMATLLVRLHLAGVYWGDCSLSNTLFRRDAGSLGAYFVDAETSEVVDAVSDGQRRQDLLIMEENLAGELADLSAIVDLPPQLDRWATGEHIRNRYEALWAEVVRVDTVGPDETWRIQERIRALNALGFSVGEVELIASGERNRLRMRTHVTDRDYHRHEFHGLTGIVAQERQAESMLNEIHELRAQLSQQSGRSVPLNVAAYRWQSERWAVVQRTLAPVAGSRADAAELYCQVLEHKWFMSEREQHDVGHERAALDYLSSFRGA